jgi:hypothetical protein
VQDPTNDVDTRLLVVVGRLEGVVRLHGTQQGNAATGEDALFNGLQRLCASHQVHRRRGSYSPRPGWPRRPGHRDPTSRLDDTLLQLFATLVAGGHFDLGAKLSNPRVNIGMPSVPKALKDKKDGDDFTPFTITASHAATAPGRHSCGGTSKES